MQKGVLQENTMYKKKDISDVIHDAHLAVGHGGRNRVIRET